MLVIVATFAGLVALAAASVQAAPLPPVKATPAELGAAPPIELVEDGCGHGWHRHHWRDQWGYWHWGHCVPSGGPYHGWGAGWAHPHADWRGPSGGWGNP
jgi:hypothetical protein